MISPIDFMAPDTTGVVTDNVTLLYFGFTSTGLQENTKKRAQIEEKMTEKCVRRRVRVTSNRFLSKISVSLNPYGDAVCPPDFQDVYHPFGAFTNPIILAVA